VLYHQGTMIFVLIQQFRVPNQTSQLQKTTNGD
jgi:hypothetical protein